ncbi:MAG: response regulator [Candidatus Omnitrophica bacterium]|nr:response regulator [Candidatus Omnitrophota bacterium]
MTKPVILIVDDEAEARSTVREYLEVRFDCDFKEACDGDEAVKFVKSNSCDVMLLDIKMPKKSGMSVIKETKEINPKVDIMVISAWVNEDVAEEASKLGAADYAVKPLDLKVIEFKFKKILEKRGQKVSKI